MSAGSGCGAGRSIVRGSQGHRDSRARFGDEHEQLRVGPDNVDDDSGTEVSEEHRLANNARL
eukprot:9364497-Lingulodinium_polyedra.AAC.1